MVLPLIAGALISGAASAISGFGAASKQRKRDMANVKAMVHANNVNYGRAEAMNAEVRARADAAAKIPIVTVREDESYTDTSRSGVDTDAFLAASAKIGINPITMMRSGTLGLFGHTTNVFGARKSTETVYGAHAMDAALAGQHIAQFEAEQLLGAPPANGMEIFGNALGDGYRTYEGLASQQVQNAHQMALVDRQLEGEARIAAIRANGGFGSVPTYVGANVSRRSGTGVLASAEAKKEALPLWVWAIDNTSGTKKDPFGNYRVVQIPNPDLPDSEQAAVALGARMLSIYDQPWFNRATPNVVRTKTTSRTGQQMDVWPVR